MSKALLTIPIGLSPLLVLAMLWETSVNDAYSAEADSLGIPLFSYLFVNWPVSLYLLSKLRDGGLPVIRYYFWNPAKGLFSAGTLLLMIWPLGVFWLGFLLIGIESQSLFTASASFLLLVVIFLVRTHVIQSQEESARP
ncbi:MAG: hypothetical protein JNJ70_21550 [Verrucomicrobiales bacterium]|nr:hypothetical protein [Verrucomicrobiales bacterium]